MSCLGTTKVQEVHRHLPHKDANDDLPQPLKRLYQQMMIDRLAIGGIGWRNVLIPCLVFMKKVNFTIVGWIVTTRKETSTAMELHRIPNLAPHAEEGAATLCPMGIPISAKELIC